MNNIDVFISYQHDQNSIVLKIVDALEKNGITCWYAPRNIISGSYAKSICEGIGKCKVFLLILSQESSESPHVLNEVEMAYKRLNNGIILIPFKITEEITNEEMNYYINRLQWIDAINKPLEKAINDLLLILKPMFGIDIKKSENVQRITNQYFEFGDEIERERLKDEDELFYSIETKIYDEIFFNRDKMNILDVNVLNANSHIQHLYRKECNHYLALCYSQEAVDGYSKIFNEEKIHFKYIDLNDYYFDNIIKKYMLEYNITGFDLINLSMVVLDLKDPSKVLGKLRKFLNPSGFIYIRDLDDCFTIYYPDSNGVFEKYFELANQDRFAGYRHSGRQIYGFLKNLNPKEIQMPLKGLSNVEMEYNDRVKLFHSYMTFLQHEYNRLNKLEPNNEKYLLANQWLEENMPLIEEQFFNNNFLFVAGFVIFVAKF